MKKESALQANFELIVKTRVLKERLSKIFHKKRNRLIELTERILVESPSDPFRDLRYNEALCRRNNPRRLQVWNPVVSVLVKHPSVPPVKVAKPFTLGLKLAVDEKQQSLELYEPVSRFTRSVVEAFKQPSCQDAMLRGELAKQEHALQTWEDSLESSARNAARISKKIGRPAAELLLSTRLRLPPPENHQRTSKGPKQDFPKFKHQERFYHSDAFFWMPQRVGPAERSIDTSLTWTERKYCKPPLTISRSHLDDILPASLRDGKRYQDQKRARSSLRTIFAKGTAVRLHCPSPVIICSPEDDSGIREDSEKTPSPHTAPSDCVHSKVCLMVEDNMYYWGEPGPQDLVEVGFVCLAGERMYNQIRLANMGKTVIRCVWFKTGRADHFNKGHYLAEHFIFDCSDRILLPCDQVTLDVQFLADYPGFWREFWHLKTTPALGPGGSSAIPISLWARALAGDDNDSRRRELERQLDVLVAERIAVNYRDQLLRNLPHRDYDTILREHFPITENIFIVDDVEVFELANPGLSYNGHAMFTILKVYRKVRELRRSTTELKLEEGVADVLLGKYQRTLEKTEQSSKAGKTQKDVSLKRSSSPGELSSGSRKSVEENTKRIRVAKKEERKKNAILVQMQSRKKDVLRRTEVDTLLDGNPADEDPLKRRNISVKSIYKTLGGLDEKLNEKNNMLMELNQAVSDMSFRRGQPIVTNFKHLVCRTALCQAADDVAAIVQRLQQNLKVRPLSGISLTSSTGSYSSGVKPSSRGKKQTVVNLREDPRLYPMSVKRLTKTSGRRRGLFGLDQVRGDAAEDSTLLTSVGQNEQAKSVVDGSYEMYSKLLYVLVYERVERLLLDLLPLITDDEQQLDPLRPRPEL